MNNLGIRVSSGTWGTPLEGTFKFVTHNKYVTFISFPCCCTNMARQGGNCNATLAKTAYHANCYSRGQLRSRPSCFVGLWLDPTQLFIWRYRGHSGSTHLGVPETYWFVIGLVGSMLEIHKASSKIDLILVKEQKLVIC